jgi:hypothetical protein
VRSRTFVPIELPPQSSTTGGVIVRYVKEVAGHSPATPFVSFSSSLDAKVLVAPLADNPVGFS